MGMCISPGTTPGWDSVLKASLDSSLSASRQNAILKRLFKHFDVLQTGRLGEMEIAELIIEFLDEAERMHFYLYGQEFGRTLAREIPIQTRLSGVSYDIWRKEFSERPDNFLSACAKLLDPDKADPGAGEPVCISKEGFIQNAKIQFLDRKELVDADEMNEVMPGIFLGSQKAACDKLLLEEHNITHILSIGFQLARPHESEFRYLYFDDVYDYAMQDMIPLFEKSHRFMDECLASGGKVLVHCQMGVSRSATLVLSFLMRMNRWDFQQAYSCIKSRRHLLDPNIGFQVQLIKYYDENYSYNMKRYQNFDLLQEILGRMTWGLCSLRNIIELCESDDFSRNHEMCFQTLLFLSSQEMLCEYPQILSIQQQAVNRLRHFQSEFVQNEESLKSFDRMFKPSLRQVADQTEQHSQCTMN